ncbi:phosphotransferase [Microbispora sp. NPDC049125]|uniref:phosphotransferase n=1 Tax=Microbispora sp. NPDC049125 TaxID=3154929 RepID=UPI0034669B0D
MAAPHDARLQFARRHLGPVTIQPSPDMPPHLLLLADASGTRYLIKQHRDPGRFEREARAYTTWITYLGDRAPQLIATDPATLSLLLTEVPGRNAALLPPGSIAERRAHHAAGAMLRQIHQIPTVAAGTTIAAYLGQRLSLWADRAHSTNLISSCQRSEMEARATALADTTMDAAICHLDYQPRNWLLADDGTVRIVDFEHMRPDARLRDLARLAHSYWATAPDLRAVFLDGYGHPLTAHDDQLIQQFAAIEALTALVQGHQRDDAQLTSHGRLLLAQLH